MAKQAAGFSNYCSVLFHLFIRSAVHPEYRKIPALKAFPGQGTGEDVDIRVYSEVISDSTDKCQELWEHTGWEPNAGLVGRRRKKIFWYKEYVKQESGRHTKYFLEKF